LADDYLDFSTQINGVGKQLPNLDYQINDLSDKVKKFRQDVDSNPILQENNLTVVNSRFHNFLILFLILGIISFLGFFSYMMYDGKFQSNYQDNSIISVSPANVTSQVFVNATTNAQIIINNNNTMVLPKELSDALIKLVNQTNHT
jgi:hypothetical protein